MPALPQPDPLPAGLPVPVDDGAADHLPGLELPALVLPGTDGVAVDLAAVSAGRWVLFVFPQAGASADDMPEGWNEIPGARGCSQEACSFRDNLAALQAAGADAVLGLSTDPEPHQRGLVERLHLPYPLLSDPGLALDAALTLPTFEAHGARLYKRMTMVLEGARVTRVFYPVFPPDRHAEEVAAWLRSPAS